MSPSSTRESCLIVGAGVFGASSAYHLAKCIPSASITLIDRSPFPCPLAASYDWQKVVRPDYGNLFYMELALKAQDRWRKDPLYNRFYHESGTVKIEAGDLAQKMVENFGKLEVKSEAHVVDSEGLKKAYPLFWDTDYASVKECYVNPTSGWAEATSAVRAATQAAVDLGVTYVEGTVSKLLFSSDGDCLGIETGDGKQLKASNIVLATGANTPKVLADSAPNRAEIQVDDRILGAAVVTGAVRLTDVQMKHFGSMPVFIHRGEAYPPTPENILKFCKDASFTNRYKHEASGHVISTPPTDRPDERQSECPKILRQEIASVMQGIFGKEAEGMEIESYRICWDAVTPNQDFIISAHPHCNGLFLATGGSFHGWKFLSILGEYVVDLLQGKLDAVLQKRWAWDRNQDGGSHQDLMPKRDWKDLVDS